MAANRPMPSKHRVIVDKIFAKGIRIPLIDDGELKPYASMGVAAVNNEYRSNRSTTHVAAVHDIFTNNEQRTCCQWSKPHIFYINFPLEESKLCIDVFNDKDSEFELIGSASYDLNYHLSLGIESETNRPNLRLERPGAADNAPSLNGYIELDVSVVYSLEDEAGDDDEELGAVGME